MPAPSPVVWPDVATLETTDDQLAVSDRPIGLRLLYEDPRSGAGHYLVRYPAGMQAQWHRSGLGAPVEPGNLLRAWVGIIAVGGVGHVRFHYLRHPTPRCCSGRASTLTSSPSALGTRVSRSRSTCTRTWCRGSRRLPPRSGTPCSPSPRRPPARPDW